MEHLMKSQWALVFSWALVGWVHTALVKEGKLKIIKKTLLDLGICKECVIWDSKRLGDRQTGKDTKKQNWLRQVSKTVQGWLLFLFATIVLFEKCCENYLKG